MHHAWNLNFGQLELEILNVGKMCSTRGTLIFELYEEVQHGRNQFLKHGVWWWHACAIKMYELFEKASLDLHLD